MMARKQSRHIMKIWFLQWRSVKSVSQMRTETEITGITGTGFAQIINNRATVLVDTCEYPEEIDIRRAKEAKERAEEQLRQKQSIQEYHRSKASLARAMERLKAGRRDTPIGY